MAPARKKAAKRPPVAGKGVPAGAFSPPPPPDVFGKASPAAQNDQLEASRLPLHDLFARQAATMLRRADLDEEQKQAILIAMNCPCCSAGGMSVTAKLKKRSR
jgi:hypothetical protein